MPLIVDQISLVLFVGAFKEIELNLDKSYYKKFISLFFPHNDWKVIVDLRYYCMTKKQEFRYHHIANEYLKNSSVVRNIFKTAALYAFKNLIGNKNIFSGFFAVLPILSKRYAIEAREIAIRYRENED